MKLFFTFLFIFCCFSIFAQQKEIILQGRVVDKKMNPVHDAYIINLRTSVRSVSGINGVFDLKAFPGDSVVISHISFLRKEIIAHQISVNPLVQLDLDTVSIKPVNVSASQKTNYEKAMDNIERIDFDFRPNTEDIMTEQEQMKEMMKAQDDIQRVEASSLSLYRFSPSETISKWKEKRQKKKLSRQYNSTEEIKETDKSGQ